MVERYVASWEDETTLRSTLTGPDADRLADRITAVRPHLARAPRFRATNESGDRVDGEVRLELEGDQELAFPIRARVTDGRVVASPSALHAELRFWRPVVMQREDTPSGRLLARDGSPLDADRDAALRATVHPVFAGRLGGGSSYRLLADGVVLEEVTVEPAVDVTLALDPEVQDAAAGAATTAPGRALVVVDASTGEVVAFAGGVDEEAALGSRAIPVGSVFKIATATAALIDGRSPDATVNCPAADVVGERSVVNASQFDLGELSIRRAFALSCNTAFARLGLELGSDVYDAAISLGFGAELAGTEDATLDAPSSDAEAAAFGFGAEGSEVSAVALASVAATIGNGGIAQALTWEASAGPSRRAISPAVAASLLDLMHDTVANGTAQSAAVAGVDIAAKTGTPRRIVDGKAIDDGLTVAVVTLPDGRTYGVAAVVLEGETGSKSAAPLSADFVERLTG